MTRGDDRCAGPPAVLGCGAWLKSAACLLDADAVHWSPMHGDLGDPAACRALEVSARELLARLGRAPGAIAHDLHPDFFSTRLAITLADELGVPAVGVQHHHAHIGVVMAEHGVREPVIGLALDGVGLGTDDTPWGGELLWVDTNGRWQRLGHLWPLALPGGDAAAREPWRMAAAALHAMDRAGEIALRFGPVVGRASAVQVERLLDRGLNSPLSSSAGRWFDAAAAALGLSVSQHHEAEAAMALEEHASEGLLRYGGPAGQAALPVPAITSGKASSLDLRPLVACLFDWPDVAARVPQAAAWFHWMLADTLAAWAAQAARHFGIATVCLGGGCFLNRVLTLRLSSMLERQGLRVLRAETAGCGDAGLALGQAWVAARQVGIDHRPEESQRCV